MSRKAAVVLGIGCELFLACGRTDGGAAPVASVAPPASALRRPPPAPSAASSGVVPPPVPDSVAFKLEGTIVDLAVGRSICVLLEGGQVLCGDVGQKFEQIQLSEPAVSVSAGAFVTCAVLASGRVSCWGCPDRDGSRTGQVSLALPAMKSIAVGGYVACGATTSDEVVCWGELDEWPSHDGGEVCRDLRTEKVAGTTANLSAIALSPEAESAAVWVVAANGRAGLREELPRADVDDLQRVARRWKRALVAVPTRGSILELQVGGRFEEFWFPRREGCVLRFNGDVACFRGPPRETGVLEGKKFKRSFVHACALLRDGSVSCWGDNRFGAAPPSVALSQRATALAVGGDHACALLADRTVSCWGAGGWGASYEPAGPCPGFCGYSVCGPKPRAVPNLANVTLLRAASNGSTATCAVTADHWLVCWGAENMKTRSRHNCDVRPR